MGLVGAPAATQEKMFALNRVCPERRGKGRGRG